MLLQICWLALMVIGIPGMGYCGWYKTITTLTKAGGILGGIIAMIASIMFT